MSKNDEEGSESPKISPIAEKLVASLTAYYYPADDFHEADETKSTRDLIEEMESVEEITASEVNFLMESYGFKLYYTGSGYEWMLKKR